MTLLEVSGRSDFDWLLIAEWCEDITKTVGTKSNVFIQTTMEPLEEVDLWLKENNLLPFRDLLIDNGYDELEVIASITKEDLQDLGLTLPGHVKKILLKTARLAKKLRLGSTDENEKWKESKKGMAL